MPIASQTQNAAVHLYIVVVGFALRQVILQKFGIRKLKNDL